MKTFVGLFSLFLIFLILILSDIGADSRNALIRFENNETIVCQSSFLINNKFYKVDSVGHHYILSSDNSSYPVVFSIYECN